MEKPTPKIQSLDGHEFNMAVERERKNLVQIPQFDLEEWLLRRPTEKSYAGKSFETLEDARREWLYDSGLPLEVGHWHILVEPREPKQMSVGGILLAPDVVAAENFKTNVGRIVHMGDGAYQATTTGGVDLRKLRTPQVGDTIVHKHYTGIEMIMNETGKRLRIMDDTAFVGWVKNPDEWRMYL